MEGKCQHWPHRGSTMEGKCQHWPHKEDSAMEVKNNFIKLHRDYCVVSMAFWESVAGGYCLHTVCRWQTTTYCLHTSGLVSSVRRALASKLRGPGFKSECVGGRPPPIVCI